MFLTIEYRFLVSKNLPYIVFLDKDKILVYATYSLWSNELKFGGIHKVYHQKQIITYLESIAIEKPFIFKKNK